MTAPTPVRLRLSREKGFKLQDHSRAVNGLPAVNCARPGKFGNPFVVGGWFKFGGNAIAGMQFAYMQCLMPEVDEYRLGYTKIETAAQAVEWFEEHCRRHPLSKEKINALRGRNLACWCALGAPCHVDTYLRIANKPTCEGL